MMDALAKRAGLTVTYHVFQTWTDLLAALERGDADVVPVLSITPARQERMLFTSPVLSSPASLFVQQDSAAIRGWSDLAGRRVGVIASGVSGQLLAAGHQSAVVVPYGRLQEALFSLLSGEVEALVSFQSSVWKVSERARVSDRIKTVGDPLTEVERAIGPARPARTARSAGRRPRRFVELFGIQEALFQMVLSAAAVLECLPSGMAFRGVHGSFVAGHTDLAVPVAAPRESARCRGRFGNLG